MNELIVLNTSDIGGETVQTVNARDLYEFLGIKSKFSVWLKNRINDFGFVENQDFVSFSKNLENGGRSIEYHISISMAKELTMVERNKKGKEARLYFIECEKVAKQKVASPALPDFTNPAIAARAWADEVEKRMALEYQAKQDAPKVEYAEAVMAANGDVTITQAAKILGYPCRKMKDYIRSIGWLYANSDTPMQKQVLDGSLVLRYAHYTNSSGQAVEKPYSHVTAKGLFKLYHRMRKENLIGRNEQLEMAA